MIAVDVFISYSTKDRETANAVCAAFEKAGARCWIAPRDISAGADWGAAIIEAIDNCRVLVLIFSSHANESVQIRNEVVRAVSRGVFVVPIRIEDIMPTKALAYYMGGVQWIDAIDPPLENHLQTLLRAIQALLGKDPPQPPPSSAVPVENPAIPTPTAVDASAGGMRRSGAPTRRTGLRAVALVVILCATMAGVGAFALWKRTPANGADKTYFVCLSGSADQCPHDYVALPCGSSVPKWADEKCPNHSEIETSRSDSFCGPTLITVKCGPTRQ